MSHKLLLSKLFLVTLFLFSCAESDSDRYHLSGNIDYLGSAEFHLEQIPLHYKYSPKNIIPISVGENGDFSVQVPADSAQMIWLVLDDDRFPLIAQPGARETIRITRADFPEKIEISSDITDYASYQQYQEATEGLDRRIEKEMNAFRDNMPNEAIELSMEKIELAEQYLAGTSFDAFILKAQGEYLVNRVKSIAYRFYKEGFNADLERAAILQEAKEMGFFTLESLKAQRAGIRDFTHYYARSFGIYDEVIEEYGQDLAEHDIKRLAYQELNAKRLEVIDQIEDRQAEAYARLTLVAERLGELPMDMARPTYEAYLQEFSEFEDYTAFLTYFYNEIKSVSPGEPAIPFTLPDEEGNMHSMSDYRGKYVLLDFWAGWCQPCLDEFPDMRRIYAKYSRDQFEIVGISTEEDKSVWRYDIQQFRNPWVQLYGGNGFDQETFKAYKGGGIPFYILIDPEGNIIRYNDIRASFNLEEVLEQLIGE